MPPASKKDCSVILFDLATQPREKAIQTLLKISSYKYFTFSKDLTKLILLNSNRTENCLNARRSGYSNIYEVAKDVTRYNPRAMMEMIDENNGTAGANWLEGLLVAVKNLEEEFECIRGIVTLQLLFITDLKKTLEQSKQNDSLINKIVSSLQKLNAFLYVVGPDIETPFPIRNAMDVKRWMRNLHVDTNNENLVILQRIITEIDNGVVCNYKMGIHLFFSYKNWGGSQPWQVPLALGSKIEIPAQTVKILDESVGCKLTPVGGTFRPPVWVDAEDESIEVDASDVISGIERHGKFVPMPDTKMFQVQNPRGFSVLCFTDDVNVPEYLMRGGGCYCVLPKNTSDDQKQALNSLIDHLAKQNKYVIARRVYNNNYLPKIVVLVPKPDQNPKCFLLASLPYADDVRVDYKEKKVEAAPKVEQNEEIYNFLANLDVDNTHVQKKLQLGINMMQNSNIMKLVNKGTDKLLDKHLGLEDIDIDLFEVPSSEAYWSLKNTWPERSVQTKKSNEDDDSDEDYQW